MTPSDITNLNAQLKGLYEERFPGLPPALAQLWLEQLRSSEPVLVSQAINRWARQHNFKAPSLDELLEQVEYVQEEQRAAQRKGSRNKNWLDVLKDAANAQAANPERSAEDATYAHLMVRLAERSISRWQDQHGVWQAKLTTEQRGEQCYAWANHYATTRPQLAEDLRAAARQFGAVMYAMPQSDRE